MIAARYMNTTFTTSAFIDSCRSMCRTMFIIYLLELVSAMDVRRDQAPPPPVVAGLS